MTYPNEVKAQALALVMQGYSAPRIREQLALICPDDVPGLTAIKEWRQEAAISGAEQDEQIMSNARDIALRAQRLIVDTLDTMQPGDKRDLMSLNIVAGTSVDKIIASRRAPAQSINIEQGIIIIQRGDAHALPPSDDAAADTIETHARLDVDIDAAVSADTPADTLAEFAPARAQPQNDGTSSLGDSSDDVRDDVGKPVQITGDEGHNQPVK